MNPPLRFLLPALVVLTALVWLPRYVAADPIAGNFEVETPLGEHLALSIHVGDAETTFELTGPDFSWFAFGFDTTIMQGYALIVEGLDDQRTVVEQNLVAAGNPGSPQPSQDISIVDVIHDPANNLSTVILQRANSTGDIDDPDFSTDMTYLDVVWAYYAGSSVQFPVPYLDYHGFNGRGFGQIEFSVVPEPAALALVGTALATALLRRNRRRRRLA